MFNLNVENGICELLDFAAAYFSRVGRLLQNILKPLGVCTLLIMFVFQKLSGNKLKHFHMTTSDKNYMTIAKESKSLHVVFYMLANKKQTTHRIILSLYNVI